MKKKHNGNREMRSVLQSTTRKIDSAVNVPAKAFRKILLRSNTTLASFSLMLDRYVKRTYPNDTAKQLYFRGNLIDALFKEDMTWKTFERGIEILDIPKVEIDFRCYNRNGTVTLVTETLDNHTYNQASALFDGFGEDDDDDE